MRNGKNLAYTHSLMWTLSSRNGLATTASTDAAPLRIAIAVIISLSERIYGALRQGGIALTRSLRTRLGWTHYWRPAQACAHGQCVEFRELPGGRIGLRDGKNPSNVVLRFSGSTWQEFLAGAKAGEFAGPTGPTHHL